MNFGRTALLMAAMAGLFAAVGFALGGQQGMLIALVIAGAMNFFAYWFSDRMVLRMHNAQRIGPQDAPRLFQMTQELARRANLPMPALYVIHSDQPNAFATGRNPANAAVAVNTGLLNVMDERQVAGVIAHELGHVANRDTLIMTITATLAGGISMLAQLAAFGGMVNRNSEYRPNPIVLILSLILAPLAAALVQMAISRTREYAADRFAGQITGDPLALADALRTLEAGRRIPNHRAEAAPATAHMFIINPLSGARADNLFSTHPATANRIAELEKLAATMRPQAQPGWGAPPAPPGWGQPPQQGWRRPDRNPWG
jgi:heat shock protein HtpX